MLEQTAIVVYAFQGGDARKYIIVLYKECTHKNIND